MGDDLKPQWTRPRQRVFGHAVFTVVMLVRCFLMADLLKDICFPIAVDARGRAGHSKSVILCISDVLCCRPAFAWPLGTVRSWAGSGRPGQPCRWQRVVGSQELGELRSPSSWLSAAPSQAAGLLARLLPVSRFVRHACVLREVEEVARPEPNGRCQDGEAGPRIGKVKLSEVKMGWGEL